MRFSLRRAALLVAVTSAVVASAAESNAAEPNAAERLQFMKDSVDVYVVRDAGGTSLSRQPEPLLRWNNAVSGLVDGTLFVWLDATGRPAAAAQAFQTRDRIWLHEFQSLSEGTFRFSRGGRPVWHPETAGIEPKPLPDAPVPAADAVGRLVQMRFLARRFSASDRFEDKEDWELRLLSKPILRYSGGPVRDGAIFALVHTTDPEVLVLLESHETVDGLRWHYALAPMTGYAVEVSIDERSVWDVPFRAPPFDPSKPFFITTYEP